MLLTWGPALGFSGLLLPFYGDGETLNPFYNSIQEERYDEAVVGISFFIVLNPEDPLIGRAFTMLGTALMGANKFDEAVTVFEAASLIDHQLAEIAAAYQVRCAVKSSSPALAISAIDSFQTKYPGSLHDDDFPQIRAEVYNALGKYNEAAQAYLALANVPTDSTEYRKFNLLAAQSFLAAGEKKTARETLRSMLLTATPGRYTVEAIDLYQSLISGHLEGALHNAAQSWEKDGAYRQAAPILKDLVSKKKSQGNSDAQLEELNARLAYALFTIHDNEDSLALYKNLAQFRNSPDHAHYLYRIAKILTRMGDNPQSRLYFQKILKEHPSSDYTKAARYQLALIDMEDNRYDKAYKYFKWRVTKPGGQQEYLHWLAAWTAFRNGYKDSALDYLDTLLKKYRNSSQRDRYLFWKGRLLLEKKETKGAMEIFKSLNLNQPLTYYGMKSFDELQKAKRSGRSVKDVLLSEPRGSINPSPLTTSMLNPEDVDQFLKVKALARLGMRDEAARELGMITGSYEENKPVLYGFATMLSENGAYRQAALLARQHLLYNYCKTLKQPIGPSYFSLVYPRGFSVLVEKYANKRNLPPSLVYALMNAESSFRPQIVSPAHAIGLMQIIPKTGHEIAGDLGVDNFEVQSLYDPSTNVRFGTHYLRKMLDRFNGKVPCAVASYNAGPSVVSKWVSNKGTLPDELFIEEIPYQETNTYVKRVTQYIEIYKALYSL